MEVAHLFVGISTWRGLPLLYFFMTPRERKYHANKWFRKAQGEAIRFWDRQTERVIGGSIPDSRLDKELSSAVVCQPTPDQFDGPRLPNFTLDEYNTFRMPEPKNNKPCLKKPLL